MTGYPTVAEVRAARDDQIFAWCDSLPPPQTAVEHTVHTRIARAAYARAAKACRRDAPEVADKWNELSDLIKKTGLGSIGRM